MDQERKNKLKKNFGIMFWVQALTEVKMLNVIITIFYVHRGLTLSQIFYLAVVFAVVAIATEVPSSYLADKWSRKGLVIMAIITFILYWVVNMFAFGFWWFLFAISIFALGYSVMSGTDEALIYDTARELGEETDSRKKLGQFFSGQRIFKIATPLMAVMLAKEMTDLGFNLLLLIDVVANIMALILATKLVEPARHMMVEKIESGVMKDAINLFRKNRKLLKIILNRTMFFVAGFSVWRVSSEYFVNISAPIIWVGVVTSAYHVAIFVFNLKSHTWFGNWSSEKFINFSNFVNVGSYFVLFINQVFFKNIPVALISYFIMTVSEVVRWPYFSDLYNKASNSYNRATTLSLANLLNSVVQIPFFLMGSVLIAMGYDFLFGMLCVVVVVSAWVWRI